MKKRYSLALWVLFLTHIFFLMAGFVACWTIDSERLEQEQRSFVKDIEAFCCPDKE